MPSAEHQASTHDIFLGVGAGVTVGTTDVISVVSGSGGPEGASTSLTLKVSAGGVSEGSPVGGNGGSAPL